MIPFSYSIRNLFRRPVQSVQLIAGSSLVILLIMTAASINLAMENTLKNSGESRNAILLGAGSEESIERSEVSSNLAEVAGASIKNIRKVFGQHALSPEIHYNGLISLDDQISSQALLRGVTYQSLWVHPKIRIIKGHFPQAGEVMVGKLAYKKLGVPESTLKVGSSINFNNEKLYISGMFDALGTVMEAEIWLPVYDLMAYTQRSTFSCVVLALENTDEFGEVDAFSKMRLDLEVVAIKETEYYAKISSFFEPIRWLAWVCAVLIGVGALLGGLNTLFAAFALRIKEFGALQAIGFSRLSLLISLVQESSLSGIFGSILAFLVSLGFLQGISFPFSIGVFVLDFNPSVLKLGIFSGLVLGLLGGIPPGWTCLRPSLPETLRSS